MNIFGQPEQGKGHSEEFDLRSDVESPYDDLAFLMYTDTEVREGAKNTPREGTPFKGATDFRNNVGSTFCPRRRGDILIKNGGCAGGGLLIYLKDSEMG